jgi:amidohydrolase
MAHENKIEASSSILESARALQEEMVATRRHIHANPELSFKEVQTASFVAAQLRSYGYAVTEGISGTGIVADLGEGKTIAICSEMDALPIAELNRSMYSSRIAGVMHACGHDAHIACVLGAAKLLSQQENLGKIRIIFQPGEEAPDHEGKSGAFRMIEFGSLRHVSAILGLHVDSTISADKIGVVMSAIAPVVQEFVLTVTASEQNVESFQSATLVMHLLQGLSAITARLVTSVEPIALSINAIHSENESASRGTGAVTIKGCFRSLGDETRSSVFAAIRKVCDSVGSTTVEFPTGDTRIHESEKLTSLVEQAATELLGVSHVLSIKRRSWASDYSLYTEHVPGAFIYLGGEIANNRRIHHSATFDIDESGLHLGAAVLAQSAIRFWSGVA